MTVPETATEIADQLEDELRTVATGAPVAGEFELANRFEVSRSTIRAALAELERRAVLRKVGISGSFRRERVDYVVSATMSPSFSATVAATGAKPGATLLGCRARRAVDPERRRLRLSPGSRVWEVARLLTINGERAAYATSVLPSRAFPGLDRALDAVGPASLSALLHTRYGARLSRVDYRISLAVPGERVADVLTPGERPAIWLAESLNRHAGGPPVELSRTYLRPDVLNVVFELKEDQ